MTIRELIAILQRQDQDRMVILSRDPEGNGHAPVEDYWTGAYNSETRETGMEKLTPEAVADGYTEEDVLIGGSPALCLVPRF